MQAKSKKGRKIMSTNFQLLKEMKKRVLASGACVDSLIGVPPESAGGSAPAAGNGVH